MDFSKRTADKIRQAAMGKKRRKLTAAEKAEKIRRRKEYITVFIRGKQKRVRRPPTIEGMDLDEFILRNADPIWLHQNEMWKYMEFPKESTWVGSGWDTVQRELVSSADQLDCEEEEEEGDDTPF
jgi:uncharacterized protein YnzC (UPF0291/DUF896 family)